MAQKWGMERNCVHPSAAPLLAEKDRIIAALRERLILVSALREVNGQFPEATPDAEEMEISTIEIDALIEAARRGEQTDGE